MKKTEGIEMNLPNKLTLLRVAMIPFFVATFYIPWRYAFWLSAILFVAAFFTDLVDGYLARKYHIVTDFGKLMDPIADKILAMAAMVMMNWTGQLSPIVTIVVLSREFIVSGLRLVVAGRGTVVAASWLGKAKTMMQFIMLLVLILEPVFSSLLGGTAFSWISGLLIAVVVLLTLWSGWDYVRAMGKYVDPRR